MCGVVCDVYYNFLVLLFRGFFIRGEWISVSSVVLACGCVFSSSLFLACCGSDDG